MDKTRAGRKTTLSGLLEEGLILGEGLGETEQEVHAGPPTISRKQPEIEDAYLQFFCPECKDAQLHVVMRKLYGDIWAICHACNVQFLVKVA